MLELLLIEREIKVSECSSDDFLEIPKCLEPLLQESRFLSIKDGRYYCLGYYINIVED